MTGHCGCMPGKAMVCILLASCIVHSCLCLAAMNNRLLQASNHPHDSSDDCLISSQHSSCHHNQGRTNRRDPGQSLGPFTDFASFTKAPLFEFESIAKVARCFLVDPVHGFRCMPLITIHKTLNTSNMPHNMHIRPRYSIDVSLHRLRWKTC
jgi:hypothetical protein